MVSGHDWQMGAGFILEDYGSKPLSSPSNTFVSDSNVSNLLTLRDLPKYEALLELARQYPDLNIQAVETCLMFLRTATDVYGVMDTHFAEYQLSMGKFMVLMLLHCSGDGLTPSECAERAGVARGTITGLLDGLERACLIARQPHPSDRRCTTVCLSDKGWDLLEAMLPHHFQLIANLLSPLDSSEQRQLFQLLTKLMDSARRLSQQPSVASDRPSDE
ncbi:MAG: MarR family winged helix-turn-helix transcriptional regulator [Leptolyngbyaceae cyanobacterium]